MLAGISSSEEICRISKLGTHLPHKYIKIYFYLWQPDPVLISPFCS